MSFLKLNGSVCVMVVVLTMPAVAICANQSMSDDQPTSEMRGSQPQNLHSEQLLADDATAFADFQEKAKLWQGLPQKPPLPEEARRFRVLAEDAIQNNDFDKAADFYEQGLVIDPMWPAGQYNAALINAEIKNFPMAVIHMKRYLVLSPDDKSARAYQDKIYIWEEKAKESDDPSDNSNTQHKQQRAW